MNEPIGAAVPRWYWVVAVFAILWNLVGCCMWCMEMFAQEAMIESMTAAEQEWVRSIPGWIYAVYATAVVTGVLGGIGLLTRKTWTIPLFAISLGLVLIQMLYPTLVAGGLQVMGPTSLIMPAIVISLAIALLWFARFANGKVWLRS